MRKFILKDGKPCIKEEIERVIVSSRESEAYQVFQADSISIMEKQTCSFVRDYIPGEFKEFNIPKDLDLNEITHTYVIIGTPEDHVQAHLRPLGDTYKAVLFSAEIKGPVLARVPLLPEQAIIIQQAIEKGEV